MEYDSKFWEYLTKLVKENEIIIDRPKGTRHPKNNDIIYECDYGYIKDTKTTDGSGVDIFRGSLHNKNVNTILCTIDSFKKDVEIKILLGCTEIEKKNIYKFMNKSDGMKAIMIEKNVEIRNIQEKIMPISIDYGFDKIFEVFEDVVGKPTKEYVKNILMEYENNNEKTLFGYLLDEKLVGIIGIKHNQNTIEILHFGVHPEYRSKHIGTKLMNYTKKENKTMVLTTDDDAVEFYRQYGYKCNEYIDERYNMRRYNCEYKQ
jgi:inorganic pyrophosphatase